MVVKVRSAMPVSWLCDEFFLVGFIPSASSLFHRVTLDTPGSSEIPEWCESSQSSRGKILSLYRGAHWLLCLFIKVFSAFSFPLFSSFLWRLLNVTVWELSIAALVT